MIRSKRFRWILLIAGLIGMLIIWLLSNEKMGSEVVRNVQVEIRTGSEEPLISEADVLNHLKHLEITLTGMPVAETDLGYIEKNLNKFPFVASSYVYLDYSGVLHLEITERIPLIRVIPDQNKAYYLDTRGIPFPLSRLHTARVPIASGAIDTSMNSKLYKLSTYVHQSEYWKPLIDHIFVRNSGDLAFTTKLGKQVVVLGDADRLQGKLGKLRTFYRTASGKIGWERFREINLKYKDQIVGK